jgi:hypothetical protein
VPENQAKTHEQGGGRRIMPRLSDEQILRARSIDLLTYLQTYEPGNIRKNRSGEYYMTEHDSLKMSNGKWFRHSTQQGGHSALDFLVKVRGMSFVDAVHALTGSYGFVDYKDNGADKARQPLQHSNQQSSAKARQPPKPLILPKPNRNNDRVVAYLRGRGIGKKIINRCIQEGLLYENDKHRCVFVGNDEYGVARFACERSITDGLKKDVSGSSKRYSFTMPPNEPDGNCNQVLALFESPIDCLAHATIHNIGQTGWDGHRLSLGGVSSAALHGFLEWNPQINSVLLCLDNDKAGHDATNRIINELLSDKRYSQTKITVAPAPVGKDYADTVMSMRQNNMKKSAINRPVEAAF